MSDLMFTATLYGTVEKAQAAQIEHLTRELTESKARIAELEEIVELYRKQGSEQENRAWIAMSAECEARGEAIDRLRAEVEALRSDVITLAEGLRKLVLALAHAASDPLYAESYEHASQLLAQLNGDSHAAQRGEGQGNA